LQKKTVLHLARARSPAPPRLSRDRFGPEFSLVEASILILTEADLAVSIVAGVVSLLLIEFFKLRRKKLKGKS